MLSLPHAVFGLTFVPKVIGAVTGVRAFDSHSTYALVSRVDTLADGKVTNGEPASRQPIKVAPASMVLLAGRVF